MHRNFTFPILFFHSARYICREALGPYHTFTHLTGPLQDYVKTLTDFCRNWNLYRFYPTSYELEPLIEILPIYANCNLPKIFSTTVFHQLCELFPESKNITLFEGMGNSSGNINSNYLSWIQIVKLLMPLYCIVTII